MIFRDCFVFDLEGQAKIAASFVGRTAIAARAFEQLALLAFGAGVAYYFLVLGDSFGILGRVSFRS